MKYAIEMLNITKKFGNFKANDDITLQVEQGEIHALLGENGAGKSTLMSILFGLYQPDGGTIKINGKEVKIDDPNDANDLKIGMVHQHFKLVHNFTVLENVVLGVEETGNFGFLKMQNARKKLKDLSEHYHLNVDIDAKIDDITVGMQQRVEILKMLFRDNEIMIFDEPTAVLTPQEIDELMVVMKNLSKEGKSIIFITHKLNEIKAVANHCTIIRKGKYIDTVDVATTSKEELSEMMVGRKVNFKVDKEDAKPTDVVLNVEHLSYNPHHNKPLLNDVSFNVRKGEIVCIAGIDGNGQTELIYNLSGLEKPTSGKIYLNDKDITTASVRARTDDGMKHIPEDRHKHGLVLDYDLSQNINLKNYYHEPYQKNGFLKFDLMDDYAKKLIEQYDVRCSNGEHSVARGMSGGNQQKAIVAREVEANGDLLMAVQPTRGLDVGAIEFIHKQIIRQRDEGKAVLLVSLELDEVMDVSDRILVMYEGEIVADLNPKEITTQELGLYMAGAKRGVGYER